MASVSVEHIEITPGICGGKPRIAGHRITVQNIVVWYEQMGMSPEEIVESHPSIGLADVYAALAYYHDHKREIIDRMNADEAFVEELRAQSPQSRFQKLLAERDAESDSLPSG